MASFLQLPSSGDDVQRSARKHLASFLQLAWLGKEITFAGTYSVASFLQRMLPGDGGGPGTPDELASFFHQPCELVFASNKRKAASARQQNSHRSYPMMANYGTEHHL